MKSLFASFLVLCLSLNSFAQKFKERYMYKYNGEDSLNLALISKERYNKQGKVVFAEYFDYFNDVITGKSFDKGKYYYTYNDTLLIKELYAGYAYQYDVWGNAKRLDTSSFADSSITEYTYKYDSVNRIIKMGYSYKEKRANPICAFGATTPKDTALFKTDDWYRNYLIEEMDRRNEGQRTKNWSSPSTATYLYKYYDDEPGPVSIETELDYKLIRYETDAKNKLTRKIAASYFKPRFTENDNASLSSIVTTQFNEGNYIINYTYTHNFANAIFTDTTATLPSRSTTYYLDNKNRIIYIHNKNDLKGDIYITRRKDGNITQIVTINNNASVKDEKHKITLLFKYK